MASIKPYQFEPESDPENFDEDDGAFPVQERLLNDVSEWCTCNNCAKMPTEEENICCKEIQKVVKRMMEVPDPPKCMVEHPGFEPNCLNPYTLQNINNIYRADYGPVRRRNEEERFRYLAFRSFVSWCWGYLGRSVRVVIPSCVVNRIRLQFPDPAGQYVGFRPPLD
ncbi:P2X purinoceptor 7-like [Carassius auratus]|uniref:P2X purinoceptor 7-like n=1 Tax=Carassius auratus TaxID=7957 RepID=A0A6P6N4I4_CARAU|nr:P2X purinoceptor 7-like [Carassius auratus]